jgi:G:T-mismatch repair DNA endonuclease (very short patch repair protein)
MANKKRDSRVVRQLARLGWKSKIIWECETRDAGKLAAALLRYLN